MPAGGNCQAQKSKPRWRSFVMRTRDQTADHATDDVGRLEPGSSYHTIALPPSHFVALPHLCSLRWLLSAFQLNGSVCMREFVAHRGDMCGTEVRLSRRFQLRPCARNAMLLICGRDTRSGPNFRNVVVATKQRVGASDNSIVTVPLEME